MQIATEIVQGFIAGDKPAFHSLYESTRKQLYAVIYRLTANQHDAEDLLHDVYVRIFEKRHTFKGEKAALYTWMYRIAVNQTLNRLRVKRHWQKDIVFEPQVEDSLAELIDADDVQIVHTLLKKMNPDFKTCLVLCEIEHKAYEEIAEILNISLGTVRSRISRGKAQLKKMFKAQGGEL